MHQLFIDLETYSDVPLQSTGLYKYVEDDSFEILLLAYALDDEPVKCIDMAQGEKVPTWLISALHDKTYVKHAQNAAFEIACLGKYYGEMDVSQWRDTMLNSLYNGYTASLEATGTVLGLAEDKRKLATGKALIRYFCVPCKPTKSNGGRSRNLPHHDPEKWQLFKEYNIQDVVTEKAIEAQLTAFPIPNFVQKQWETDLKINRRGVMADMQLVNGALTVGDSVRTRLLEEAYALTGLENPNSVAQLSGWLQSRLGHTVDDLRKGTVSDMLQHEEMPDDVRRVLEIRQELGKTSNKKYVAIKSAVCKDGRVRGLLQFYGANRTGRWAGRLVQVQNLPRTYVSPIELARDLVRRGKGAAIELIYGSVQDTLSQLIRTAFVSSPGHKLIDADFSAIEARVISWLADEKWRLEVFKSGGDIYCASASQMFGVPVEKHGVNGHLRQKGKVAELALGYQGGTGALIQMGALEMGLHEAELPEIVNKWRDANPHVRDLWQDVQDAAVQVIQFGGTERVQCLELAREFDSVNRTYVLTIKLPSGRKLFYVAPRVGQNRWGGPSIEYMGLEQGTRRFGWLETYGGKLVENCVQAIARDCLAEIIERLEGAGYTIVFHVHDEVVIDLKPYADDETMLADVVKIMSKPINWAPDLPLNADGWVGDFFTKD